MADSDPHPHANEHSHEDPLGEDVKSTLSSLIGLVKHSLRPLPTATGDGTYVEEEIHSSITKDLLKLRPTDAVTVKDLIQNVVTNKPIDDRTYFMEGIIKMASELPLNSQRGRSLTNGFLKTLWDDLEHPPLSYLDERYKYRQADGSHNNIRWPQIGAAGTPYARTVRPKTPLPYSLPDPGVLFDSVMVRKEFEPHPNKISSVLFYLATVIIHDIFRTSRNDQNISTTSSYLDLAPLYGSNQEEQDAMRTKKDGKLKPDCFSEKRILGQPLGVGVLLIMYNRFHNDVATKLPMINEGGRFTKPADTDLKGLAKYDDDIFQTARLITCGLYINCILKDYVRVILNMNSTESAWDLDPRSEMGKSIFGEPAEEAIGNQVSAEFNLVYRWHAAISERDERWSQEHFTKVLHGKDPSDLTIPELMKELGKWEAALPNDPQERPFGTMKRQSDGTLPDDDLVSIWTDSVRDVAGAFGANKVPKMLRSVEILGIIQARKWNVATLNEFRAHFNLKKHETFEEINPDPEVAEQLKHLYEHPDYVELYPGLVVEEAKKPIKGGSGLCPSYTVSRAVLSDAVALVRGDRFYTVDYTPRNLTNWGFSEVAADINVDQGHVFYKLILRALPHHFKHDSVYAHFPLTVPSQNKVIMAELDHMDEYYNFDVPAFIPSPTPITTWDAGAKILSDQKNYKVTWGESIQFLMEHDDKPYGKDFMLSGDGAPNAKSREVMHQALFKDNWYSEVKRFYENITIELLKDKSHQIAGVNTVDVIRDVGNIAQTHFAAEVFSLPLKTKRNPRGIYSEHELYLVMALVFSCIFFDADPQKSFPLRQAARKFTQQLGELVVGMITPIGSHGLIASILERFHRHSPLPDYGVHMITKLLERGYSVKELVWTHILPTAGGMVANQGQLFAQCLDYYLSDEGKPHFAEIKRLAKLDTKEADDLLLRYFMEGARIRSSVGLYRDVQKDTTVLDGDKVLNLKAGDRVLVNLVSASHDARAFPNPEQVDLSRSMDSYVHYGWGPHSCLGLEASKLALTTMLKTVAKLENLRRVPGPQGVLQTLKVQGFSLYMSEDGSSLVPFPTSMKVCWDGPIPEPSCAPKQDSDGDVIMNGEKRKRDSGDGWETVQRPFVL